MDSPLFRMASKKVRDEARRVFGRSQLGQALTTMRRRPANRVKAQARIERFLKQHAGLSTKSQLRRATGPEFDGLVKEIERYARGGRGNRLVVDDLLGRLGPVGKLIGSLIKQGGKSGLEEELEAAAALLGVHGYKTKRPGEGFEGDSLAEAMEIIAKKGLRVVDKDEAPEEDKDRLPFGISRTTKAGKPRKQVSLAHAGGGSGRYPIDHPIVTGEMVRASSGSVHSYGYDIEAAVLYIRFLHTDEKGQKTSGPGPLYRYNDVEPELFAALHKDSSKGSWVWDNLRIRGTVSGHKKDYALVGVSHGYVPRKATLTAEGESFIGRRVHIGGGKWLTSRRPDELVRRLVEVDSSGRPKTGAPPPPNRGKPRTARPR